MTFLQIMQSKSNSTSSHHRSSSTHFKSKKVVIMYYSGFDEQKNDFLDLFDSSPYNVPFQQIPIED
jgi:hypothetical protein